MKEKDPELSDDAELDYMPVSWPTEPQGTIFCSIALAEPKYYDL